MAIRKLPAVAALAILAGFAGAANATTFTGSAVGAWQNLQAAGVGNVDSIANNDAVTGGSAVFSFGVGAGTGPNTFSFNGLGSDSSTPNFNTADNTSFDIGHFSYFNGVTNNYPQSSSIDLGITLTLTSPVSNVSSFAYNFGIDITPNNSGDPVKDGDIVTIANGLTATNFTIGGTVYTLQLLGFSIDHGATFTSQFLSPEQSTANADIYATITTNVLAVPEPASLALFAGFLVGLGMLARRRRDC